ncbi:MAG: transposase [Okeania sp. SIO3B5]|uniref:zinc ribbon domain-containing protein n=1 Tax=Okeania sp. SIO3B5 TaxID=2607811 RepID=UPI001400F188|nr:zinc ribbon domain-containing protein [Okeania sp. SIO3B5]NEO54951.1 transposase [Okeania sp. SIO3B5]
MLEVKTIAVNPNNTSQDCSNCRKKVPKELNIRTHCCPHCCAIIDHYVFAFAQHPVGKHDLGNGAINIKNRATGYSVLKASWNLMQWQGCETRELTLS